MNDFHRLTLTVDADGQVSFVCPACASELEDAYPFEQLMARTRDQLLRMLDTWQRTDGRCQLCEVTYAITNGVPVCTAQARGPSPWAHAS